MPGQNILKILIIFAALILANYSAVIVKAQSEFKPPLYCMGLGNDCSDTPAPSIPPATIALPAEPCAQEGSRSFFANFIDFFYAFFNPSYRSSRAAPCPQAPGAVTPGSPQQPAAPGPVSQGIQFVSHEVAQVGGEDMSITVNKPSGVQEGDIIVAMIGSDYAHVSDIPYGWVTIRQDVKNSGHADDLAMQSYYKIVTSEEMASYTWNLVTARDDTPSSHQPLIAVDLYAFRGVDLNEPILSNDVRGETVDPTAIECPSVAGITGGMLLCAYIGDDPGPITAPGSMQQTSNFEISGGDTYAIAYETLTSDGDTGSRTAQWDNPGRNNNGSLKSGSDFAHAIVLRPGR